MHSVVFQLDPVCCALVMLIAGVDTTLLTLLDVGALVMLTQHYIVTLDFGDVDTTLLIRYYLLKRCWTWTYWVLQNMSVLDFFCGSDWLDWKTSKVGSSLDLL